MADSAWIATHSSADLRSGEAFLHARGPDQRVKLAPMVAFFGAGANQLNFETEDEQGRKIGSLSYAWSKAMQNANAGTTYRGMFEAIKNQMAVIAPRQTPQAEGDLDQLLLAGKVETPPPYYRVQKSDDGNGFVLIDGGWLLGLNKGSVVGFFPPETRDPSAQRPWAKGVVEQNTALSAGIKPDGKLTAEQLADTWVYLLEANTENLKARIYLKPFDSPVFDSLKNRLLQTPGVSLSTDADLIVESDGANLLLLSADDQEIASLPQNTPVNEAVQRIMQHILAFGRVNFMRKLELRARDLKLKMEIVPVRQQTPASDSAATLVLRNGDTFRVRVSNQGSAPAYFTILDVQPDHRLNIIIPAPGQTPEEYRLAPGKTVVVPNVFKVGPPFGTELLKLIATGQPVDLRAIASDAGSAGRKNTTLNPFEKLFEASYFNEDMQAKGGDGGRFPIEAISVSSVSFVISP